MRPAPALAAVVLSLSLLTACGGDDGGADDETLSKTEFIAQGDAVCKRLETEGETLTPPADEQDLGRFIREAVTLAQAARDDFAALTPPADGEQVQTSLLDALDASLESAEGAAKAADDGDTVTAGDLLDQASEQGDAADQEATAYGFKECGSESD